MKIRVTHPDVTVDEAGAIIDDLTLMQALVEATPDVADAVRRIARVLPGKRRNYSDAEVDPFDNFITVSDIEETLYRGMEHKQNTPQGAILHMLIHKVVRLVRGAEWEESVGEGQEMSSLDIHGYAAILHGWFIRRGKSK